MRELNDNIDHKNVVIIWISLFADELKGFSSEHAEKTIFLAFLGLFYFLT